MKKFILLILVFIAIISCASTQQVQVKIDPFTNEKAVSTDWQQFVFDYDTGLVLYASFFYNNDSIELRLIPLYAAYTSVVVSKDSPLAIKFNNGSIMILHSLNYAIATKGGGIDSGGFGSSQQNGMKIVYRFTSKKDSDLFFNNLASDVRFSYSSTQGGVYNDGKVTEKNARKIQEMYKDFITEINNPT